MAVRRLSSICFESFRSREMKLPFMKQVVEVPRLKSRILAKAHDKKLSTASAGNMTSVQ